MPTVDIPSPVNKGAPSGGIGGIPTPLLLIAVGGGIGLIVFLTKKSGTPSDKNTQDGTLLPNTAVMLGSLQQMLLETEGKITTGNADLSSQLSGVGSNLGLQLDTQSAAISKSFSDLSTNLNTSVASIKGQEDALATIISQLGTQQTGLADSLGVLLTNLKGVEQQVAAGQTGAQTYNDWLTQQITGLLGSQQGIITTQNQQTTLLNALGKPIQPPAVNINQDWNIWNNSKFYTKNGMGVIVQNGKLFGVQSQGSFDSSPATMRGWINLDSNGIWTDPAYAGAIP